MMDFSKLLKQSSAVLPLVMSSAALVVVLMHLQLSGVGRDPDEGGAAHIFQLLILAQVPLTAFFAWRFVPKAPKSAFAVIALQACAAGIAMLPVWWLKL